MARKVVIDDRLPVDRVGGLICSFTRVPGELWVSVLEKAFVKLHGQWCNAHFRMLQHSY